MLFVTKTVLSCIYMVHHSFSDDFKGHYHLDQTNSTSGTGFILWIKETESHRS